MVTGLSLSSADDCKPRAAAVCGNFAKEGCDFCMCSCAGNRSSTDARLSTSSTGMAICQNKGRVCRTGMPIGERKCL